MKQNTLECQFCGRTFVSKRNDARYCCNSHRQLAYFEREGWGNRSSSAASAAIAEKEYQQQIELKKMSATLSDIKETMDLIRQKREDEFKTVCEDVTASFDSMNKGKALNEVRNGTLKIIETLFEQDASGEVAKYKIKCVISDINFLFNSASFENVQAEFSHAKFIQETLLPHLEEVARSLRRSHERYMDYEIPREMKRELQKIHHDLQYA